MFKRKDGDTMYHPEWKELVEQTKELPYDTFLSFIEIEHISGVKKSDKRFSSMISNWQNELLEMASRWPENVYNKGYRIVQPNEHTKIATKFIGQARRKAKKATKVLVNTEKSLLTDDESKQHQSALIHASGVYAITQESSKNMKKLGVKFKPLLVQKAQ